MELGMFISVLRRGDFVVIVPGHCVGYRAMLAHLPALTLLPYSVCSLCPFLSCGLCCPGSFMDGIWAWLTSQLGRKSGLEQKAVGALFPPSSLLEHCGQQWLPFLAALSQCSSPHQAVASPQLPHPSKTPGCCGFLVLLHSKHLHLPCWFLSPPALLLIILLSQSLWYFMIWIICVGSICFLWDLTTAHRSFNQDIVDLGVLKSQYSWSLTLRRFFW